MSTNVGEIDLSLILNSDKFRKQLNNIDKQADVTSSKISTSLSKIGKAAITAFSIAAVVKFGKTCLDMATKTSNAWIGLNSILTGQGKNFEQAKKFINDYISDGLVPLNNAVASYKNLALRGYNSDQIQKTMNALKNSATFARQSTYSLGDAVQTATEGLKNENSVVVDNAGVTKNVAKMWEDYAKSIGKTTNNLTQAEKIQAEVNGILEETKFQSNDASIYASTYSGKIAQLNTAFTSMKTVIGNAIQPLGKLFIPVITNAVNAVTKLFTALSGLLSLFGLKADSVETVSNGIGNIVSNAEDASNAIADMGDSAKNASKKANGLAAFDNLNVLPTDNSSGSGSSSSSDVNTGITDSLDVTSTIKEDTVMFDGLINRLKELASVFKDGFDISFGNTNFDGIIDHLKGIKDTLVAIWTDTDILNSANQWTNNILYSLGQAIGSITRIGTNIAEGFVGSIDKYLSKNSKRIKKFICNMFSISSKDITLTGNFMQALGEISDVLCGDAAKQIGADIIAIFTNPFMNVTELCGKFALDLKGILFQPIIDNTERVKTALENLLGPLQTVTGTLGDAMTYVGDKWNEVYDEHIHPLMQSLKSGLSDTFGKFLDVYNEYVAPMLQRLTDKFNELWNTHLQPFMDNVSGLIGSIVDAVLALWNNVLKPVIDWIVQNTLPVLIPIFESLWNRICDVFGAIADTIGGIIQTFKGLIDFIVGIFTGDWNTAWEGIKNFFEGIWNTIKGVISIVWNSITGIINATLTAIKGNITKILNAIKSIWSNIWNGMKRTVESIFNGIWSTIKGVINSILGGVESMSNGVIDGINGMIKALNNLSFDIPKWVPGLGGKKFGFDIGTLGKISLPRLAEGGYVKANTPQLAVIGDNKHQGEITAPEDKIIENVLEALKLFFREQANFQSNNKATNEIILNFTGSLAQFIRILKPELDKESKRRGDKLVLGGANG